MIVQISACVGQFGACESSQENDQDSRFLLGMSWRLVILGDMLQRRHAPCSETVNLCFILKNKRKGASHVTFEIREGILSTQCGHARGAATSKVSQEQSQVASKNCAYFSPSRMP